MARITIQLSSTAASSGAPSRRQTVSPRFSRAKKAATARDVRASKSKIPSPPVVPSQKKSLDIGSCLVIA
jgi:hypothetical protein